MRCVVRLQEEPRNQSVRQEEPRNQTVTDESQCEVCIIRSGSKTVQTCSKHVQPPLHQQRLKNPMPGVTFDGVPVPNGGSRGAPVTSTAPGWDQTPGTTYDPWYRLYMSTIPWVPTFPGPKRKR